MRKIPDDTIDRAIEHIRSGMSLSEAAEAVGIAHSTLSNALRRRSLSFADLTPRRVNALGHPIPIRARRYPCRYCGAPVTKPGAACQRDECQRRRAADWKAKHPQYKLVQRVGDNIRDNDRRREDGRRDNAPDLRSSGRRRIQTWIYMAPESLNALRQIAERERRSVSYVINDALYRMGLIPEP